MIKSVKKNTKRVFCILASSIIAFASIFMFLPKEKKSAKALSNDTEVVKLDNFPIKLNFLEYLSVNLGNACFTVDNCLLDLSFDLYEQRLDFKFSTFVRNQDNYIDNLFDGSFNATSLMPFTSSLDGGVAWKAVKMYESTSSADLAYAGPARVVTDYKITRKVGNTENYNYYLAKLVDYVGYNSNATSYFQILDQQTLFSSNRDIIFAYRTYRTGNPILLKDYANLLVEYSGVCKGYEAWIGSIMADRVLYSPILKLTFFASDINNALIFEFPCDYGYTPFSASYPIIDGVVDTTSQSYINGYNAGFSAASSEIGSDFYNEGVEDGKQIGYADGYEKGAQSSTTFFNLFSSAVNAPIKVLTDMFNFDILGVNMRDFFLGLVSLAVITTVIRWFV